VCAVFNVFISQGVLVGSKMRSRRNLSDEEMEKLSAEVEEPSRRGGAFEALWAVEENLKSRSVEKPTPEWESYQKTGKFASEEAPWYPRAGEIREQLLPSAGRMMDELMGLVSPQVLFDPYGEGFTEQQREIGSLVSDLFRSVGSVVTGDTSGVPDAFLRGSEIGMLRTTREEDIELRRQRLESQYPETAPLMLSYDDPDVGRELEQREFQRQYPSLAGMSEGIQTLTPIHPERGWQGTHALSRLIEQEPAEFGLDIALSATGLGIGAAGIRGGLQGIRVARRAISPLEGLIEAFDDFDLMTDELTPAGRLRRATLDVEVQGTRSWDVTDLSRFGRRPVSRGTGTLVSPTEMVTASHLLTGQPGQAIPDLQRITARTYTGEQVDISTISGISPEADIAVLDLPGIESPLSLDVATDIAEADRLYGRLTRTGDYRTGRVGQEIIRDEATDAALREMNLRGQAGRSGAGVVTESGELGGVYLGVRQGQGMLVDAPTVGRFLESDRATFDVRGFDRESHRQRLVERGLHFRAGLNLKGLLPLHAAGGWNVEDWEFDYEDDVGVKEVEFYHPDPVEVEVQGRVTGTDPTTQYERVEVAPTVEQSGEIDPTYGDWALKDIRPKGSSDALDVENWAWEDLQRETFYGDYYRAEKARGEMERRIRSQRGGRRDRERERWKAQDKATAEEREEMKEAGIGSDFDAEGHFVPMSNPDAPRDYTETYEPQDYQREAWESGETAQDIDDTGLIDEGWSDPVGDFNDPEWRAAQEQQITGEGEVVGTPWIEEFGTSGTLEGDLLESEKVSSLGQYTTSERGLQPGTVDQMTRMFSGLIERSEIQSAAKQGIEWFWRITDKETGSLPPWLQSSAALRKQIIREADERHSAWREMRFIAETGMRDMMSPGMRSHWESQVRAQHKGWREETDLLWREGRFQEFQRAVRPLQIEAVKAHGERYRAFGGEPQWKKDLRESYVSDYQLLMEARQERVSTPTESHVATPPRALDIDPDAELPLEIRQAEATRLAQPPRDYYQEFAGMVYAEETERIFRETYEVADQSYRQASGLEWHQREAAESQMRRENLVQWNLRHAGLTESPEEIVGTADELREAVEMGQRMVAGREASQRARQAHEQQASDWRRASEQVRREQSDPQRQVARGAEQARLQRNAKSNALRTLKEMAADRGMELDEFLEWRKEHFGKDDELHSYDLPSPLDLDTPRARLRGFPGIMSDRTYGLEIELITDLEKSEMERALDAQIAEGLTIEPDYSIKTARPEIAIQHEYGGERQEAADFLTYQEQYRDAPGHERATRYDFETRYSHELVFPIMRGEQGIDLIESTLRRLREFETELNTSMGMHVHVGAEDLRNYDLVGLWGAFAARENVIDLMHEPSRRGSGSTYARSLDMGYDRPFLDDLITQDLTGEMPSADIGDRLYGARRESLLSSENRETFLNRVGYGDRYQKLNLRGFEHQTIEYRQPVATLDIDEISGHIGFITDFVDEFAGKPLEWAFERDPRLQQQYAGLDLAFGRPSDAGQLLLDELHSAEDLTPSQRRAMEHTYGPAVVMAGPGSGKSRTLIERLRYLSDEGIATSDEVLTLVFGREAREDLRERASELGGDWRIQTIDAFARSVVRENFGQLGYSRAPDIGGPTFRGWLAAPGRLQEYGASDDVLGSWSDLYERTRQGFIEGREDYSQLSEQVQGAIQSFRREKLRGAQMDYSDAISQAGYLFETNESLRQQYQDRYKFLQVDEFQDVSGPQSRLIRHLSENPWVVGDLDQSIMQFRGASGTRMREMLDEGATLYNIEENFRSTPEIVGASQGFIASNLGRIGVSQRSVNPSGHPVSMVGVSPITTEYGAIERIAEQVRLGEQTAILTRTRRERDVIEEELPILLGQQGWEESDLKDLLTYSTMHLAKGREWQNVILPINLLESDFGNRQRLFTLPSPYAKTDLDFAEEERLFYVGMTRAEENLTIMGDPNHPYFQQVERAIAGTTEDMAPSYLTDVPTGQPETRGGVLGRVIGRLGGAFDRLLYGETQRRTGRTAEQRRIERIRERVDDDELHSLEDRDDSTFYDLTVGILGGSFFDESPLPDSPMRGRRMGLGDRFSRRWDEMRDERSWGGLTYQLADAARSSASINVIATAAFQGVFAAAGHDLNVGSLLYTGGTSLLALGATAFDARFGSRGVMPEPRFNLEHLAGVVSDVPEGVGENLQRILRDAGAGTSRWGRGSLARELERYDWGDLESMFGVSGTEYLTELGYQTRRFGQRSFQEQWGLGEAVVDLSLGQFPRRRRYTYDPEQQEVSVDASRWSLDRLIEAGSDRFALLDAWRMRREMIRENPDLDNPILRTVFGPLQPEDATPSYWYFGLPMSREVGRFIGRYHAEGSGLLSQETLSETLARLSGSLELQDRLSERKEFRRDRASALEARRMDPSLYEWQDPDHFYRQISGRLGVDASDFEGFGDYFGSPYSRLGHRFSGISQKAAYPLTAAVGLGLGYYGKDILGTLFGDDEEPLELEDPDLYSGSHRYPGVLALQRTRPFRRLRARGERMLDDVYGEDSFHGEMMKSMLFGKRKNLPGDVRDVFLQTGRPDALVFSGLHISMGMGILSRFPALMVPPAISAVRDTISPPDEEVVDASRGFWNKYTPKDSPWIPRWNPEVMTQGQLRMFKSEGYLPEDYEVQIPEAPSWAWWDPVENYWQREARIGRGLGTQKQIDYLQSLGMVSTDYRHEDFLGKGIGLDRGTPGVQDVLPWMVYSMLGVVPQSAFSYFRTETGAEEPSEGYRKDGFEFDVQGSPHPGFNPWLDPHPEGSLENEDRSYYRGLPLHLIGDVASDFASGVYQAGGSSSSNLSNLMPWTGKLTAEQRAKMLEELNVDITDGLQRDEIKRMLEYRKNAQESRKGKGGTSLRATEYLGSLRAQRTGTAPYGYPEDWEPPDKPIAEYSPQETSFGIYYEQQLLEQQRASRAETPLATSPKATALLGSLRSQRLGTAPYGYTEGWEPPDKPIAEYSPQETSFGIYYEQQMLEQQRATRVEGDPVTSPKAMALLGSLRSQRTGAAPYGYPEGWTPPDKPIAEYSPQETSFGIYYEQQLIAETKDTGVAEAPVTSPKATAMLGSLRSRRLGTAPYGYPEGWEPPDKPIEEYTPQETSFGIYYEQQFQAEDTPVAPKVASDASILKLQSLNPERYGEPEYEVMNLEDIDLEVIQERGYYTPLEISTLIDYEQAVLESKGPPRASEAAEASIRRQFPKYFADMPQEEIPLVPLPQLAAEAQEQGYIRRDRVSEWFRHVRESPPPPSTPRQLARLRSEFPHMFKRMGRAEDYIESGQSYAIVQSLEDIYDADTLTGRLVDTEGGRILKEDTVRLGDFNAPELVPDRMKPKEYQEREAARGREARDVFHAIVEQFNVDRDVEAEGYVVPLRFRQDPNMPGGNERGFYGRVLADTNFQFFDYEQFMIQQQMGSVYGADIEWGAEEIDPLALWRRTPTFLEGYGDSLLGALSSVPGHLITEGLQGRSPVESFSELIRETPSILKSTALSQVRRVGTQVSMDFIKERILGKQTPNNLSFMQRYVGDFSGLGERFGGFGEKAGGFFQGGWGAAIAPIALAAGTAWIGEQSLDRGYADVIPSQQQREQVFTDYLLGNRDEIGAPGSSGSEMGVLRAIKKALREVLSENGLASMGDFSTRLSRELRESDSRGITRRGR